MEQVLLQKEEEQGSQRRGSPLLLSKCAVVESLRQGSRGRTTRTAGRQRGWPASNYPAQLVLKVGGRTQTWAKVVGAGAVAQPGRLF